MAVSYMTKDGYDKILAEINYLETVPAMQGKSGGTMGISACWWI